MTEAELDRTDQHRHIPHPFVPRTGRSAEKTLKVITLDKKGILGGLRAADTSTFSYCRENLITEMLQKCLSSIWYHHMCQMIGCWPLLAYLVENAINTKAYCCLSATWTDLKGTAPMNYYKRKELWYMVFPDINKLLNSAVEAGISLSCTHNELLPNLCFFFNVSSVQMLARFPPEGWWENLCGCWWMLHHPSLQSAMHQHLRLL